MTPRSSPSPDLHLVLALRQDPAIRCFVSEHALELGHVLLHMTLHASSLCPVCVFLLLVLRDFSPSIAAFSSHELAHLPYPYLLNYLFTR
jgi:hypothetical protein